MQIFMLTFLILAFIQSIYAGGYDDYPVCRECKDCVVCDSVTETYEGQRVTLRYTCGDTVNWACCRSSSDEYGSFDWCNLNDCNAFFDDDKDYESEMCSTVSQLTYDVPFGANYLTVQIQDNDFNGEKDCGSDGSDCCCGSYTSCGSATSGVCEVVIDLNACRPTETPAPECYLDEDCYITNDAECTERICSYGSCVSVISGPGRVCRPVDADKPCDVEERCDGYNTACPEDKKDYGTVCREAKSACDFEETCDGNSDYCPPDTWYNYEQECRPAQDYCDVAEYCTGDSGECPEDVRYDHAYTFKCSTTQFLCGISRDELSTNSGGSYFSGSCGIGTARDFVDLPYPACLDDDLKSKCPNNRGLSNWSESHCDPNTGNWVCDNKQDVGASTVLPYRFSWN
jgi:hypothetical protein